MAIKKKRIEKGMREELNGLNPHSKGDIFSRIKLDFIARIEEIIITTKEIQKKIHETINKLNIIYINLLNFMIGSHMYFLYYINLFFIPPISKLKHKEKVIRRQQNVNIRRRLQIQNGGY